MIHLGPTKQNCGAKMKRCQVTELRSCSGYESHMRSVNANVLYQRRREEGGGRLRSPSLTMLVLE